MQQANGVADGGEAAKEDMANVFVLGGLRGDMGRSGRRGAVRDEVLKHGDLVSVVIDSCGSGEGVGS